jgi:RsiW-degrading membrane proteinase PrsW (M82 family)
VAGWLRAVGAAACWRVIQDAQFGAGSVEELLGALPVVAGFSSRLRIRDIVDGACLVRDLAGLVIGALVASPLTRLHLGRDGSVRS